MHGGCAGSHCALYLLGGAGADGCDGSHCALYLLGGGGADGCAGSPDNKCCHLPQV